MSIKKPQSCALRGRDNGGNMNGNGFIKTKGVTGTNEDTFGSS